ncbi:MAG: tetratricopeptide repeat protein [Granulosicoccus sp.]
MFNCFDTKAVAGKAISALVPVLLLGCSSLPLAPSKALAQSSQSPVSEQGSSQSDMDSQLMFELMIAELAGRRGQLDVAMAGYLRASEHTDDPRVSERATRLAMFGRQWGEAEKVARRWISLDPDNKEAPQILGQTLLRQDNTEAAAQLYNELLEGSNNRRQTLRDIQFELQRNENPQASVFVMESIVFAYSKESEAHLGLARAHITANDNVAALEAVETAVELMPGDTDSILLRAQILSGSGKPEAAFSSIRAAMDANPDNADLRLGYAQLLVEGGRHDEVGDVLDTIYNEATPKPDTLLTISLLAIESRRIDQARVYLEALLASGSYSDQANFYLGRISDDQKEYDTAISYYDAVEQSDLQFTALLRAAELTALTGNLEEGRSRLRHLSASVSNPALQPRLVTAESRMLQNANQSAEAVLVLSDGLERFPDDTELLYARGLAANSAGDDAMMIIDLNRLIELDPQNAHALNALGYHYADENIELELAEDLLVKANALLPDDPAIMDSLGWLRFRQGRYDEAIVLLENAYQVYPDPEIAAHLAEALWLSGAQTEAQTLIEAALESNPDDERLLTVKNTVFK